MAEVTADFLYEKLRPSFGGEGQILMGEVRNAAGFQATRSLDAMSYGLWQSKGWHATGFEIKVARSDWLKELSTPEKSEAFRPYCKYFYLVADRKIAESHEIPDSWGFLEWNGRRLVTVKKAPANENILPFSGSFVAALLKNSNDYTANRIGALVREELAARENNLRAEVDKMVSDEFKYKKQTYDAVNNLMERLGVSLYSLETFTKNDLNLAMLKQAIELGTKEWSSMKGLCNQMRARMGDLVEKQKSAEILLKLLEDIDTEEIDREAFMKECFPSRK